MVEVIRYEHQRKLDAKMTTLLEKALTQLEDRLDNGDVNPKTGERIPISGAQIASITGTIYDKRALVRGEPTSRVERTSVDQKLNKLAERFEEIGKKTGPAIGGNRTPIVEESDVKH